VRKLAFKNDVVGCHWKRKKTCFSEVWEHRWWVGLLVTYWEFRGRDCWWERLGGVVCIQHTAPTRILEESVLKIDAAMRPVACGGP